MNQPSPRLWIFEGSYAGQASRLISKDFRTQTSDLEPTPRKARRTR